MEVEERLIAAVSDYPELYNSTLSSYKDPERKAHAWRAVSLQVELPEEDCRKKWKSLRDVFIKDKRSEQRRRASGGTHRSWKYRRQMAFLTPFIQSRSSSSGLAAQDLEDDGEKSAVSNNSATGLPQTDGEISDTEKTLNLSASVLQALKQARCQEEDGGLDGTEDEMFLMSLLPHLKRLPYEKKCAVKLKFHQLLYEAEFL
ncbi:hypothetical protein Z043_119624 [Scleropages formosus]|uniref:Transcription factor Adf-1-like n=1 Tax=Scleropages formosus TaxID=113540 RepID=A0A0P7Y8X8_SCLFO|nr:hypothetical protein Z043_119624 [Scleropages formosus]